ncbi:hypothetical protein CP965_01080 [Halarcobacter mediterraneus]|uniref:Uncharacterized protein n=1 Tax=Halarcobacter mediterraneus TaxID=2023153 RepID=A0A4Q1AXL1_9BACT|nr:DUF1566 domain-containing protein [Halarcobacter mediterraneus]RXK14073.1 hypothetical protein CP965_01080 [Halarcobacter mediterraneus]
MRYDVKKVLIAGATGYLGGYVAKGLEKNLKNGWRLPTFDELRTILDSKCEKNTINSKLFPDIKLLSNS